MRCCVLNSRLNRKPFICFLTTNWENYKFYIAYIRNYFSWRFLSFFLFFCFVLKLKVFLSSFEPTWMSTRQRFSFFFYLFMSHLLLVATSEEEKFLLENCFSLLKDKVTKIISPWYANFLDSEDSRFSVRVAVVFLVHNLYRWPLRDLCENYFTFCYVVVDADSP